MKIKPPCYNDGSDCPRRYVGCRAGCEAWHEWMAAHEAEKEARRKDRQNPADDYLIKRSEKNRKAWGDSIKRGYRRK